MFSPGLDLYFYRSCTAPHNVRLDLDDLSVDDISVDDLSVDDLSIRGVNCFTTAKLVPH